MINIHKYLPEYSGGAQPRFHDSPNGFELTLPLVVGDGAQSGQVAPQVAPQVTPQVTPQVADLINVMEGAMSRAQMMEKLVLKDREHFREHYLQNALQAGLIEYTIPDKPTSRLQKYRLTKLGKQLAGNRF